MRIGNLDLSQKTASVQTQRSSQHSTQTQKAQRTDQLLLSPRASLFTAARAEYVQSVAQRSEKITRLTQQVQSETYRVDLNGLAEAFMRTVVQEEYS